MAREILEGPGGREDFAHWKSFVAKNWFARKKIFEFFLHVNYPPTCVSDKNVQSRRGSGEELVDRELRRRRWIIRRKLENWKRGISPPP